MDLTKTVTGVTVKDADQGTFEAHFATYEVVDHDRDITTKGALPIGADVVISAYGHGSHKGKLPVGRGVLKEVGDDVLVDGQFFLDTTHGRDTFLTVKGLGDLQEWSYSLHGIVAAPDVVDGQKVRRLNKVTKVKEVSPVLIGAGIDTHTVAIKGRTDTTKQLVSIVRSGLHDAGKERWGGERIYVWPIDFDPEEGYAIFEIDGPDESRLIRVEYTVDGTTVTLGEDETDVDRVVSYAPAKSGTRFVEHLKSVVTGVQELVGRAQEVRTLRAAQGKALSEANRAELVELAGHLDEAQAAVKALTEDPTDPTTTVSDEARKEYLRFVAANA